ncbi:MAG: 50S ribosomal protein L15 [Lentisphaerae bacterium GWF2_45_14]|nr:MAG: 50S ribosomal protein L15 [Lentisphaerae bacterium GWF2_45_14]
MKLHDMHPTPGSRHKRKRVGRGDGSGSGRTAGRGEKGQKSRSGYSRKYHFEGGQVPLIRRLPKKGFKSPDHKEFNIVNVEALEKFFNAGDNVDPEILAQKGIIGKKLDLKILAEGEITKPLNVKSNAFSAAAKAKIEAAGGKCEKI